MHIQIDAPDGYVYHYKNSNEYGSTVYIGEGRTVDDYELVTEEEYKKILAEEMSADEFHETTKEEYERIIAESKNAEIC